MRGITWIALVVVGALIAVGAAATAIGRGSETEQVSATFEARAIGSPNIKSCTQIREGFYSQFEASYEGSLTSDAGEEFVFTQRGLDILVDEKTGFGSAEATWLLETPEGGLVGSGELIAVFFGDPGRGGDPSEFTGNLRGMLLGSFGDPGFEERRAIWNFSASLAGERTTGVIGDPGIAPNPGAILIPPGPC